MSGVDDHHLGGTPGGAARFDGARGAIADLEKAHQPRCSAAARQTLAVPPQPREVRTRAGAIFEQPRLTDPQVHDAAFVHEIVGNGLDETRVRLRVLVGGFRPGELARLVVDVKVPLARAINAVGPEQAGVEPLRRVWRRHLHREHVDEFVEEGARIRFGVEIGPFPSPVGPGAGEPLENLFCRMLSGSALLLGQGLKSLVVRNRAAKPRRNALFIDRFEPDGHTCLAKILLREHVGGDLRPGPGHFDILGPENHGSVRVADFACRQPERDACIGGLTFFGVAPLYPHLMPRYRWARRLLGGSPSCKPSPCFPPRPWPPAAVRMARRKSAQRPVPKSWGDPGIRHVRCVFPKGTTRPLSGAVRQRSGYADAFRRAPGGTSNHSRRTT